MVLNAEWNLVELARSAFALLRFEMGFGRLLSIG